uniref:DNA_pol_E_B domain-containing protein n=1 Tax=Macrostomum lignano TaxID=282301 RepID=A0A1I8FSA9_9PLAT
RQPTVENAKPKQPDFGANLFGDSDDFFAPSSTSPWPPTGRQLEEAAAKRPLLQPLLRMDSKLEMKMKVEAEKSSQDRKNDGKRFKAAFGGLKQAPAAAASEPNAVSRPRRPGGSQLRRRRRHGRGGRAAKQQQRPSPTNKLPNATLPTSSSVVSTRRGHDDRTASASLKGDTKLSAPLHGACVPMRRAFRRPARVRAESDHRLRGERQHAQAARTNWLFCRSMTDSSEGLVPVWLRHNPRQQQVGDYVNVPVVGSSCLWQPPSNRELLCSRLYQFDSGTPGDLNFGVAEEIVVISDGLGGCAGGKAYPCESGPAAQRAFSLGYFVTERAGSACLPAPRTRHI